MLSHERDTLRPELVELGLKIRWQVANTKEVFPRHKQDMSFD